MQTHLSHPSPSHIVTNRNMFFVDPVLVSNSPLLLDVCGHPFLTLFAHAFWSDDDRTRKQIEHVNLHLSDDVTEWMKTLNTKVLYYANKRMLTYVHALASRERKSSDRRKTKRKRKEKKKKKKKKKK